MKNKFALLNTKSLVVIFLVIIFGIVMLVVSGDGESDKKDESGLDLASEYRSEIERIASSMCSSIKGVESARVNITLEGGMSYVYAKNSEGSYGGTYFSSGGDPLFLKYDYPKIVGCAVVYSGVETSDVKLELINMMSAYLGISSTKIYVGTQ